jgi:segregation and condensation protein B
MDESKIKYVIEAALLAAGRPLTFEKLASLFAVKASELDKATLENALAELSSDYRDRGLELKEVSSGYRLQIKSSMSEWLTPLWEERAPRYTRALLETLALVAYRQPITRGEIEEVRGVAVSTNIMRTLLERSWVRVVGHRDVPGRPEMFGTTREFLDYFGLKRLEDLPPLADIKDGLPELSPQTDLIDALVIDGEAEDLGEDADADAEADADANADADAEAEAEAEADAGGGEVQVIISNASATDDHDVEPGDLESDEATEVEGGGDGEEDESSVLAQAVDDDEAEVLARALDEDEPFDRGQDEAEPLDRGHDEDEPLERGHDDDEDEADADAALPFSRTESS